MKLRHLDCNVLDVSGLGFMASPAGLANNVPSTAPSLSFKLNAGEVALMIGCEQDGKSALLSTLMGNRRKLSGSATICGHPIGTREAKRLIGYVPYELGLFSELTCLDYLGFFAAAYEVESHYRPYLVREALAMVRLEDCLNTKVSELDAYQSRRLALARALVHDPRLLLIDECLLGVSGAELRGFLEILVDIRNSGKSLLLTTSQLAGLEQYANLVFYLISGMVYLQGRMPDLLLYLQDQYMMQIQLLDAISTSGCLKLLHKDKRVFSLYQSSSDRNLLRFLYSGSMTQFNRLLADMRSTGVQIVSCWENAAYFAH